MDLVINEDNDRANELFHEIVVERSREIFESIMAEEDEMEDDVMEDDMGGMGGQVGDLLDEINAEESGVVEGEDEEFDLDDMGDEDGEDEVIDLEADGVEDEGGLEDRVVDLEDKLDQLMAEFEDIMGGEGEEDFGGDEGGEEDFGDEGEEDFGDEEVGDEEAMMEAVQLKNVPGLYGSKIGGDNGVQTKSPSLQNSGQAGMDSRPVKFAGASESVPTSPKGPSNAYAKGETQVKGAGSFKNAPAQKGQDLEKAPAPVKSQASGVNTKSPVSESRRTTAKKRI